MAGKTLNAILNNPTTGIMIEALLSKALSVAPESLQDKLKYNRRRPRRTGKSL